MIIDILDSRGLSLFKKLILMSLAMGLAEMTGVLSIVPFLAISANPGVIESNGIIRASYDWFEFSSMESFIVFLGISSFLILFISIGFRTLTFYFLARFVQIQSVTLGCHLVARYLAEPYEHTVRRHATEMSANVHSEVSQVVDGALINAMRVIAYSAITLCLVALLFFVDPVAALAISCCLGLGYGAVFSIVRKKMVLFGRERVVANKRSFHALSEALAGIREVKLHHLEHEYFERYRWPARQLAKVRAQIALMREIPKGALELLTFGSMILFVFWVLSARDGDMRQALPVLGVFAFAGARLFPVLQRLFQAASALRAEAPALELLHADLKQVGQIAPDKEGDGQPIHLTESLELRNAVYRYPDNREPTVDGLSLTIPAHSTIGIVGPTGAGKTTTVDLILGLLTLESGRLSVDGVLIDESNVRAWQRSIAYVPQDIYLADTSIAANIAFGVAEDAVDRGAMRRAAEHAGLHDFVMGLPDGYETQVGERGVRLSGGQRQRIGIARALFRDPSLLILDEATSALDGLTEQAIFGAIKTLSVDKTIILIAHRLSTVRNCNSVVFVDEGHICDVGAYDDLVRRNTQFRALHEAAA